MSGPGRSSQKHSPLEAYHAIDTASLAAAAQQQQLLGDFQYQAALGRLGNDFTLSNALAAQQQTAKYPQQFLLEDLALQHEQQNSSLFDMDALVQYQQLRRAALAKRVGMVNGSAPNNVLAALALTKLSANGAPPALSTSYDSQPIPAAPALAAKIASDEWQCPECGHINKEAYDDCDACGAINPNFTGKKTSPSKAMAGSPSLPPPTKKVKLDNNHLPVTILSGFLGSGKTTLLKYILQSPEHRLKIAVIVNDMADLNIDADTVQQQVVQAERELVRLDNGCICCTLRGDLIREIARIKQMQEFDYLVIESTGIAEPQQVAEAFVFSPETQELAENEESMLWTQARLDTCVTVIDAHNFSRQLQTLERFADKFDDGFDDKTPEGRQEGKKSIAELLVEQVEFANVIILNKIDLVTIEERDNTARLIQTLNPKAKLIPAEFGKIKLKEILNTQKFDMKEAGKSAGWLLSLNEKGQHSEVNEYGVMSFVYRARIPFHSDKLTRWMRDLIHFANDWMGMPVDKRKLESDEKHQRMEQTYGTILRAKGWCWFAGKDSYMFGFTQNGRIGGLVPIMEWYTARPENEWGITEPKDLAAVKAKFVKPHGDRRQELVFIGTDLKVDEIRKALDACLLTQKELEDYKFYNDDEL